MAKVDETLAREFVCARCKSQGGEVQRLAMSGTGISRLMDIQPYRYLFVSCNQCGYTEIFNLKALEDKKDDLGLFLDALFAG
ncbi:MAG: hypothetical protein KC413_17790 [Anaerolineales bacterium]|nr:hypothetical protein [Anaerolineales bacterium]